MEGKYHYKLGIEWDVTDKVSKDVSTKSAFLFTVKDKKITGSDDIQAEREAIAKKIVEETPIEEELTGRFNINAIRIACSEFDEKYVSCTDGINPEAIILEK